MGTETEHKFLVRTANLPASLPPGEALRQGYLALKPTVRVRICEDRATGATRAYLTIKGPGTFSRAEYEYDIPVDEAREMFPLCGEHTIEKIRRKIDGWELDEFLGRHAGLWLVEYELKGDGAALPPLPPWVGREVSEDRRYTNGALASQPFDKSLIAG